MQFKRSAKHIRSKSDKFTGSPLKLYQLLLFYHPAKALERYPFLMLEKNNNKEFSNLLLQNKITPRVHLTTWDDYAILSMVEKGLGISILPRLILKRIPHRIVIKSLEVPAYRKIGFAVRLWKTSVQYPFPDSTYDSSFRSRASSAFSIEISFSCSESFASF